MRESLISANTDNYFEMEGVLPLSLNINCCWCTCYKFDLIYRKYMQHLYLQINLLKN
jgi:hypothetical protein